jgi:hypothetical protein
MVVIDKAADCEHDFYEARRDASGRWVAGWQNSIRLSSDGVYPKWSARGSGFGLLGGVIFPAELRQGEIRHALLFSFPYTKAGAPTRPATESDGTTDSSLAIPMGTRVRLDPTLDLNTLTLTPYERTIAIALQRYGMILGDTGGGISLYAVHPQSYKTDIYAGLLPETDPYARLPGIPVDRLQVLQPF